MKRKCMVFVNVVVGGLMLAWAVAAGASDVGDTQHGNYARPFEPPTRPAFIPLPPGAVEPAGWLRDWCLAARDGYTGHMDEYDDEFKRAWAADHTMTGDRLFWYNGAWPYEGGGYWFDGLARLGFALHDDALIQQAKRRLDAVADHMRPNGILFLWWLDKNNPDDRKAVNAALDGWPLWASGQLGRAMVSFYAGSGDPKILQALRTAYSGDSECLRSITGSMSNLWPALDTYTWTGDQSIADALTAMFDKERPGLKPTLNRHRTVPDLRAGAAVENQHVVEFIEGTTPWVVGYLWTGEAGYLQAALGWHELLDRIAMQPHGVPVSDEWYGPTGAFRGSETCDVAGYVWSQLALLAVSGDGRMADRAERAFFNAGAATVSRDFKTHVYFQSPNRFANGSPDFPHGPRAGGGSYQPKHGPLCCTAALNRVVPYYVTQMWMATQDNGLAATCYGPCKVTALAADRVPVEIVCRTDYPFNETIEMSVQPAREAVFPLYVHIPGWCANPELRVNGSVSEVAQNSRGFACVSRSWKPGDTVRLHFPMTVCVKTGRDISPGGPLTGEHKPTLVTIPEEVSTQGAPYASVSLGPLLFALAIPDTLDANTPDPSARWKFALDVQHPRISVERQAMPARWNWPLESPLKLKVQAAAIDWTPAPESPRLPDAPVVSHQPLEEITLIPYGCTKFRISMFPVTADAADAEPISPTKDVIPLFNGKNLDGLYTWLQDTKYEDPRKVFTVEDGMLRISGDAGGYICTKQRYRDYHLVVEYRWGERTWQSRKTAAKDSGVIVHCADPDGSFGNVFMAGIEAQVIEGGTGDFLVLPGTRADGSAIPASLTAETTQDRDGETVWKKGGPRTTFNTFTRINWFGRDPDWKDELGFRGQQDVESPAQGWTRLDVICDGGHILYRVNDVLVNEAFDSVPSSGKILIQTELAEIYVRRFELHPLTEARTTQ